MTPQPAKPRVMVVDDNPMNRAAFESVLERDYTVRLAASGQQALEHAFREEFTCACPSWTVSKPPNFFARAKSRANLVESLHVELSKQLPARDVLTQKIRELESAVGDLDRQMTP